MNDRSDAQECPQPIAQLAAERKTRTAHCDRHGDYLSQNYIGDIWKKCPQCASEEAREQEAKRAAEKRAEENRRWLDALGHAQIPKRYLDRRLDNYRATLPGQKAALEFAQDYARNFVRAMATGQSVLFVGSTGTGKNHLSIGIAQEIMRDGHTAMFTTTLRAIRRIKETWNRASTETETQAVAALAYPDLLILDEIGVQFGSEAERTLLFDVINERYERRRPVIYISNLDLPGVLSYLGDRVYSRIMEDGGRYIAFDWDDYRRG